MNNRTKMARIERAKQFAPFDALKGMQDIMILKEYEHNAVMKGEVQEEQANKISKILINANKNDIMQITYYNLGHYIKTIGKIKVNFANGEIEINDKIINLLDIFDVEIIEKK